MYADPMSRPTAARKPLRIGLLTHHNPYDRRAFSGTVYFAAKALEQNPDVALSILGPHRPPHPLDRLLRRKSPRITLNDVSLDGLDAVVGLVASHLLDPLLAQAPDIPVIHVTDATPAFLRDVYGWNVPLEADASETRVAAKASATVYSSEVMANRAAADLGLPGFRPGVVPFGVNIDTLPKAPARKPSLNKLHLLFVGLDWQRKGGDIAVAALNRLRAAGVDAHLTIVGRCPPAVLQNPAVTYLGFLNKNRTRDAARLNALYARSHLLVLPSRGDCTPMVVTEAMAFGTPVIGSDVGGIGAMIGGAGAGRVMAPDATPEDWFRAICDCTANIEAYRMMSDAAFDRTRTTLSWTRWADGIERTAREIVVGRTQSIRIVA